MKATNKKVLVQLWIYKTWAKSELSKCMLVVELETINNSNNLYNEPLHKVNIINEKQPILTLYDVCLICSQINSKIK